MITASVSAGSSLLLEPARELLFPLPDVTSPHRPRCTLTLTNLSVLNDVVFRIRTRNPDAFTVRPTHGLVAPGTSIQVTVTATTRSCQRLRAMGLRDVMTRQSSELFLVQSVEREEEVQAMEPLNPNSSTSLRSFWKNLPRECVTENKLVCCFVAATSDVLEGSSTNEMNFSRGLSNASLSSKESRTSQNDKKCLWMSAREPFSTEFRMAEEPKERSRQESFHSDTSFYSAIEPPVKINQRSDTRTSASADFGLSRSPRTRLRDSAFSSISLNDSSVSDTTFTAQTTCSTDIAVKKPTCEVGPLLYHIQPDDILSFDVKPAPRFWGSKSCFIVNSSQNDCLMFKVRTSNQSGYVVKPSRGLVSTTNAQEVVISLCAPRHGESFDPTEREAKDGFMIEIANISRDKYDGLIKLDERKHFHEINSLWSHLSRNDRQSTKLSVRLNMKNSHSDIGIPESSESAKSNSRSKSNKSRTEKLRQQTSKSVVQVSTPSSTGESHGSVAENKINCEPSDSDESVFTIASTPVPAGVGENNSGGSEVSTPASHALRNAKVFVVSVDRMDTVDFSNPKLSFFI
ncbi:unnamed protein product [Peronospora destructor]|uniref:MSP domain-containing protein n=2 Tax=Peronospora destructor TaxID=86335 RepID=A0AAV0VCF4_9STRA|nr:unnamed protein product [Peronospora destructor]